MRVLVACEFSGIVREAFKAKGHDAWSCDFLDTEILGQHIKGDVLPHLNDGWDLMIAHPPCTYLAVSGAAWFKKAGRQELQDRALDFVRQLLNAPIPKIALENLVGVISTRIRKPDQIIQPYQFGHPDSKKTCLWLKNLPKLTPTSIVEPQYVTMKNGERMSKFHYDSFIHGGKDRWKIRSRTFKGIATAMAEQWGNL
jgi:hypothetical protein